MEASDGWSMYGSLIFILTLKYDKIYEVLYNAFTQYTHVYIMYIIQMYIIIYFKQIL